MATNPYQYQYKLPTDFDPWQLNTSRGENANWNWENSKYYNAANDKQRFDLAQTGEGTDSNRGRVLRWMQDNLGENPGGADPVRRNEAFAQALARLRQDYSNNGMDWNQSGLQGFDQFMQQRGTEGVNNLGGRRDAPGSGVGTVGDAWTNETQGGGTYDPVTRRFVPPKTNPATTGPTSGGRGGSGNDDLPDGTTRYGIPGGIPSPGGANPPPGTNPPVGPNGERGTAWKEYMVNNPDMVLQEAMIKRGLNPNVPGVLSNFIQKRYAPMIEARIAAEAAQSGGNEGYINNIENIINEYSTGLFNGGGNFYGQQREIGQNALAGSEEFLRELDPEKAMAYIEQMMSLSTRGFNPMVQEAMSNVYGRERNDFVRTSIGEEDQGRTMDAFNDWLRKRPSWKVLGNR